MTKKLPKAVLDDLKRSGLTADDAARMGVYYVGASQAAELLGKSAPSSFGRQQARARELPDGYAIPYLDSQGRPTNYVRLRLLGRHYNSDGKVVRYLQPQGSQPHLYYPAPLFDLPTSPVGDKRKKPPVGGVPLWFTEGEKKAYALAKLGFRAVGLGGVDAWRAHEDGHEVSLPLADLDNLDLKKREVLIVFDSDIRTKPSVRLALLKFARYLLDRGARPREVEIPEGLGKGVDDAIVALGGYTAETAKRLLTWGRRDLAAELEVAAPVVSVSADVASNIKPKRVEWLWPGRFARGCFTMLAGDPGLGKSFTTLDCAARVSRGTAWPDGEKNQVGDVVILSAEDDVERTLVPRLIALGADLSRITIVHNVVEQVTVEGKTRRVFDIAADAVEVERILLRLPNPLLVIVDPISAYMGGADGHANTEVRAALVPLGAALGRRNVAGVLVSHLNKGEGAAIYRVMGSLAFVAAARAAFMVVADPDDPSRRFFLPAKNNLAPLGTGLAYHIETVKGGAAVVRWSDEPIEFMADEILRRKADGKQQRKENRAITWLAQQLVGGAKKASELVRLAEDELGISKRTLEAAKRELGVEAQRQGGTAGDGSWWWHLPEPAKAKF